MGSLGSEPVEMDLFDVDSNGRVFLTLLPQESLSVPLSFLTMLPHVPSRSSSDKKRVDRGSSNEGKVAPEDGSDPLSSRLTRVAEVRVISCTHGHVVSVIRVSVCPKPFVVHRTLRFYEAENSIMRRRVRVVGGVGEKGAGRGGDGYPGSFPVGRRSVYCVEIGPSVPESSSGGGGAESGRVVVEWGEGGQDWGEVLELLIRYRLGPFPSAGSFYLLLYSDPHRANIHEVMRVSSILGELMRIRLLLR